MDNKYSLIESKRLADAILWMSGGTIKYFTYDSIKYEGQKVFSFEDTEEFRNILAYLQVGRSKFNKQ